MHILIKWHAPLTLNKSSDAGFLYSLDGVDLPDQPRIYIFARTFGNKFEALYVGQTRSIRKRIKTQLNNLKVMNHIRDAKAGRRILLIGEFIPGSGKKGTAALELLSAL